MMADIKPSPPGFRKIAELASIALMLPSSIIVGLIFGYFLDRWLGTAPWLLLIFMVLGVVSGILSLVRALERLNKDQPPDD
jgi:ATP synthase protein I